MFTSLNQTRVNEAATKQLQEEIFQDAVDQRMEELCEENKEWLEKHHPSVYISNCGGTMTYIPHSYSLWQRIKCQLRWLLP